VQRFHACIAVVAYVPTPQGTHAAVAFEALRPVAQLKHWLTPPMALVPLCVVLPGGQGAQRFQPDMLRSA
jgi:hypothetical protein